jgi:ATP-binding protein involved in chromosome partitioning
MIFGTLASQTNVGKIMHQDIILDFIEPITGLAISDCISSHDVSKQGDKLVVQLSFNFPYETFVADLRVALTEAVKTGDSEINEVILSIDYSLVEREAQGGQPVKGVKNVIAVASGKGGVGKSTTSVNLALALSQLGAKVGILDADIYGPSQPDMTGLSGKPDSTDGKSIIPMVQYGLEVMSIGFLVKGDDAIIWRGPMATGALEQLLRDTLWGYHNGGEALDYLIIDLPPGTGDIQLTLAQKIPVNGSVIVTTPQDIALLDVVRAVKMFEKVKLPILGVVENMSTHICSNCGHEERIFGEGGAERLAKDHDVEMVGSLPLDIAIREHTDAGKPTVIAQPDSEIADQYRRIAVKTSAKLSAGKKSYKSKFPNIVIE